MFGGAPTHLLLRPLATIYAPHLMEQLDFFVFYVSDTESTVSESIKIL
jgi:hypothetical protein